MVHFLLSLYVQKEKESLIILFLCISLYLFLSFELSILPSFKYHVFSLIFSFSYSLSSPFLTPHHTGSLLPSPQLPLPLRFSPLLYCPFSSALSLTVHSTLIFIFFSLLALLFHLFSSHVFYSTETLSLCNLVLHGLSEF